MDHANIWPSEARIADASGATFIELVNTYHQRSGDFPANVRFILLADRYFDKLESALRLVRERLAPAYHTTDDEYISESLARAEWHIDQLLKALDKDRS